MRTSADKVWDMTYLLVLALVLLASLGVTVLSLTHGRNKVLIVSDGKSYYIWARSLLLDHDIDFRNDFQLIYPPDPLPPESAVETPAGHVVNIYPVGMAILEVPGLLLGHVAARYVTHSPTDGVSLPYQVAVAWSLMALYFASFILLYRAMLNLGVTRVWALAFSLMSLLGSNLIHYVVKEPGMAHAAGVAVFNILLFLITRWSSEHRKIRPVQGILLGALVGLFFLIRNTNILIVPVLVAIVGTTRRVSFGEVVPILAGAAGISALQPVSLWFLWGRLRISTYVNESFTSGMSGVANTLLSPRHGLLVYHPWYAILFLLVVYAAIRLPQLRRVCIAAIASFLLMALANGTWCCWWFGDSFGNRAFIETIGPLSIAAALSASHLNLGKKATAALIAVMLALVAVNLYLWVGYLLQAYPFDGNHTVAQAYLWSFSHSLGFLLNRLSP
jgi:hypothetical protein